jgi:preprotein translocase subunit SecD
MRKKAIIKLSVILTLVAAVLVFTFLPINGINKYRGVVGTMSSRMDAESGGGMYAVYQARVPEKASKARFSEQIYARQAQVRYTLAYTLQARSINVSALDVTKSGDRIRVDVPDFTSIATICEIVEQKIDLAVLDASGNEVLTGDHIVNARLQADRLNQGSYELIVELDAEGVERLSLVSGTLSVVDKEQAQDRQEAAGNQYAEQLYKVLDNLSIESATAGRLLATGTDTNALETGRLRILAGARPLELRLTDADAILAEDTELSATLLMCGGIAAAVLGIAFLIARYRGLGLLSSVSFLAVALLLAFFMAVLPFSQISWGSAAAMTVAFILSLTAHAALLERVKTEYALGKSVQASIASAFKRLLWPLLDIHILGVVTGAALWILGDGATAGFGSVLLMGAVLSSIAALAFTRWLIRLAIQIYGDGINAAKLSLKRPTGFKESDSIPDPEPEADDAVRAESATEAENV